ncbi:MAG: hypothetical protein M5U28_30200 [Sandaracinaceae bacterium]|nr:hypothetical protein [Sandaracinaceae bacterium]
MDGAWVGVADHGGWAILVTVGQRGAVLDRRRVELVEAGLPAMPHHHEAQSLPIERAVALVERVAASAGRCAKEALDRLVSELPARVEGVALRARPALPDTIAERIRSYRAQCVADWVMYREALAGAARARSWSVRWYDAKTVSAEAAKTLGEEDIATLLEAPREVLGPPWQKDHRVAMAAAIVASRSRA